jgi:hypothetical protein
MGQGDARQRNGERIRNEEDIGFCPAVDPIELKKLKRLYGVKHDRSDRSDRSIARIAPVIFDDRKKRLTASIN